MIEILKVINYDTTAHLSVIQITSITSYKSVLFKMLLIKQGRELVSLANDSYDAGYHQVIWNADSHSSGVYFVKMVAGGYANIQKLMLVK